MEETNTKTYSQAASGIVPVSNPRTATQVVTKQTKWILEASVVTYGIKNEEKIRDSIKIETRISKCFKQRKIKSVMHRASRQEIVEVDDKTEEMVANWQPDLLGESQCRHTGKQKTRAIIPKMPLCHIRCNILVSRKQRDLPGKIQPSRKFCKSLLPKKRLQGGYRRRRYIHWSATPRSREGETTKTQSHSVLQTTETWSRSHSIPKHTKLQQQMLDWRTETYGLLWTQKSVIAATAAKITMQPAGDARFFCKNHQWNDSEVQSKFLFNLDVNNREDPQEWPDWEKMDWFILFHKTDHVLMASYEDLREAADAERTWSKIKSIPIVSVLVNVPNKLQSAHNTAYWGKTLTMFLEKVRVHRNRYKKRSDLINARLLNHGKSQFKAKLEKIHRNWRYNSVWTLTITREKFMKQ